MAVRCVSSIDGKVDHMVELIMPDVFNHGYLSKFLFWWTWYKILNPAFKIFIWCKFLNTGWNTFHKWFFGTSSASLSARSFNFASLRNHWRLPNFIYGQKRKRGLWWNNQCVQYFVFVRSNVIGLWDKWPAIASNFGWECESKSTLLGVYFQINKIWCAWIDSWLAFFSILSNKLATARRAIRPHVTKSPTRTALPSLSIILIITWYEIFDVLWDVRTSSLNVTPSGWVDKDSDKRMSCVTLTDKWKLG